MCIHCVINKLGRTPQTMRSFLVRDEGTMALRLLAAIPTKTHITEELMIQLDCLLYSLEYSKELESYESVYEALAFLVDADMLEIDRVGHICKALHHTVH